MTDERTRVVAGCMTGTSLDGLDVALVKITGTGLDMKADLLAHHAAQLPDGLRSALMSLASGLAAEPIVYMRAARALGELHAEALEALLAFAPLSLEGEGRGEGEVLSRQHAGGKHNKTKIDFVTAHGQTIWHAPRDPRTMDDAELPGGGPKSWQLFDPWPIVRKLNVPVCYDLRQADLIAGGEGAPLTPIADWVMFKGKADVVINLGGVANCTWMPRGFDQIRASDLSGCNLILDGICQRLVGRAYDRDGELASKGRHDPDIYSVISKFIGEARRASGSSSGASMGRENYGGPWFAALLAHVEPMGMPEDILRNAVMCVANPICSPVYVLDEDTWPDGHEHMVVLAGGGARNRVLVEEIQRCVTEPAEYVNYRYRITLSDALGIPCEAREAMAFAVLGALSQDGVPISLPQVTGAKDPGVAGVWAYP